MLSCLGCGGRTRATAGGHMQPVRGTFPTDRRKPRPVLAGLQPSLGSSSLGGLGIRAIAAKALGPVSPAAA